MKITFDTYYKQKTSWAILPTILWLCGEGPHHLVFTWLFFSLSLTFPEKIIIRVGDFYEDCNYMPRVCTSVANDEILGRSLVDNSVGCCNPMYCVVRRLTECEAKSIAVNGPSQDKKDKCEALNKQGWHTNLWWKK